MSRIVAALLLGLGLVAAVPSNTNEKNAALSPTKEEPKKEDITATTAGADTELAAGMSGWHRHRPHWHWPHGHVPHPHHPHSPHIHWPHGHVPHPHHPHGHLPHIHHPHRPHFHVPVAAAVMHVVTAATTLANELSSQINRMGQAIGNFATDMANRVVQIANDIAAAVVKFAEMIADFFKMFMCNLSPGDFADALLGSFSNAISGITGMINDIQGMASAGSSKAVMQHGSWALRNAAHTACALIWLHLETSNPSIAVILAFVGTVRSDCPALSGGGSNIAMTLGVTLSAGIQVDIQSFGVGGEAGVGVDSYGNKFCYIGACITRGATMLPDVDADVSVGVALTVWRGLGDVIGLVGLIDISIGFNFEIVPGANVGVGFGLSYFYAYGGNPTQIRGVGVGVEVSLKAPSAKKIDVSVSAGGGTCWTPLVIGNTPNLKWGSAAWVDGSDPFNWGWNPASSGGGRIPGHPMNDMELLSEDTLAMHRQVWQNVTARRLAGEWSHNLNFIYDKPLGHDKSKYHPDDTGLTVVLPVHHYRTFVKENDGKAVSQAVSK